MIRADREALERAADGVLAVANKAFAHVTRADVTPVTASEVDGAIEAVGQCVQKYVGILTSTTIAQLEPVAQFNTSEPFTFPWVSQPDEDES